MDIDFVVRSDAQVKSGGDSIQVEEYRSELQMRGHDVRVIPFSPSMSLRKTAVIHFVNLDRPFDYLVGSSLAAGQPRVISPIHHDLQRIRLMRRNERGYGFRSLIGRFLPENGREFLAFFVRGLIADRSIRGRMQLVKASLSLARHIPGIWARVGVELNRMDRVLLLANGEGHSIQRDTGWAGHNSELVPNGRPSVTIDDSVAWVDRSESLLCVGRIEPRKRQLDIARAAVALGVRVTFVGDLVKPDSSFGIDFLEQVGTSSVLEWLGPLPREETLARMNHSRVLVNASWVEVQSLVDLEASFLGCWVIATPAGNSREWLPESVQETEGFSVDGLLSRAVKLLGATAGPPPVAYEWTWSDAGSSLADLYEGLRSRFSPSGG